MAISESRMEPPNSGCWSKLKWLVVPDPPRLSLKWIRFKRGVGVRGCWQLPQKLQSFRMEDGRGRMKKRFGQLRGIANWKAMQKSIKEDRETKWKLMCIHWSDKQNWVTWRLMGFIYQLTGATCCVQVPNWLQLGHAGDGWIIMFHFAFLMR